MGQRSSPYDNLSELHVHPKYNWDATDEDLIDTVAVYTGLLVVSATQEAQGSRWPPKSLKQTNK